MYQIIIDYQHLVFFRMFLLFLFQCFSCFFPSRISQKRPFFETILPFFHSNLVRCRFITAKAWHPSGVVLGHLCPSQELIFIQVTWRYLQTCWSQSGNILNTTYMEETWTQQDSLKIWCYSYFSSRWMLEQILHAICKALKSSGQDWVPVQVAQPCTTWQGLIPFEQSWILLIFRLQACYGIALRMVFSLHVCISMRIICIWSVMKLRQTLWEGWNTSSSFP